MRFFQNLLRPTAPQDPVEGAIKMLALSQLITIPMTLTTNLTQREEVVAKSAVITLIHISALILGFGWGAINWCLAEEPERRPVPQR